MRGRNAELSADSPERRRRRAGWFSFCSVSGTVGAAGRWCGKGLIIEGRLRPPRGRSGRRETRLCDSCGTGEDGGVADWRVNLGPARGEGRRRIWTIMRVGVDKAWTSRGRRRRTPGTRRRTVLVATVRHTRALTHARAHTSAGTHARCVAFCVSLGEDGFLALV
jgi:hypothetical protein